MQWISQFNKQIRIWWSYDERISLYKSVLSVFWECWWYSEEKSRIFKSLTLIQFWMSSYLSENSFKAKEVWVSSGFATKNCAYAVIHYSHYFFYRFLHPHLPISLCGLNMAFAHTLEAENKKEREQWLITVERWEEGTWSCWQKSVNIFCLIQFVCVQAT